MRRLILSDIHANLPAFEAVLEDAGNVDEVIFLGDLSNFGPHPAECVDLMRELSAKCIMGNHDLLIADKYAKRNFWDEWARAQLDESQIIYLLGFSHELMLDNSILALHGSYSVNYDILPNTHISDIEKAFSLYMKPNTQMILFGHYHYQIDRMGKEAEYHCIRPVGHHRDKDTRASYSILDDMNLYHVRIPYDIERTIYDVNKIDCLDMSKKDEWKSFLRNAYDETLLKKDICQMRHNEERYYD